VEKGKALVLEQLNFRLNWRVLVNCDHAE